MTVSQLRLIQPIGIDPLDMTSDGARPAIEVSLPSVWQDASVELVRLVGALGMDRFSTDDVLQEVYLMALRKCPASLSREEMRRWLFRVAVNRCHLEHRQNSRWRRVKHALAVMRGRSNPQPTAPQSIETKETQAIVHSSLKSLPPIQQTVLVMRYFNEFDSKEIGQILEIPDSTVRSHLLKARKALAAQLQKVGYRHE